MESRAESLTSSTSCLLSWFSERCCLQSCRASELTVALRHLGVATRLVLFVRAPFGPAEVDAESLGGAERVLVELADHDLGALFVDDLDIEAERLHLLDEHLEALGDARLGDVLALDDRLVDLHAP